MRRTTRVSYQLFKLGFLCAITVALAAFLTTPAEEEAFLPVPFVAMILNFVVSGWAVVMNTTFNLPPMKCYHVIRSWEIPMYELLGVRQFKRLVTSTFYGTIWGPRVRKEEVTPGAAFSRLLGDMKMAETAHMASLLIVLGIGIYSLIHGWFHIAIWLTIFNILINAYPVMLQRYNRVRIGRMLTRLDGRKQDLVADGP